jgi:two-component system NarL family sensor kinase
MNILLDISTIEYLVPVISGIVLFGLLTVFVIYFIQVYRKTQGTLDWERERIKQELLRVENEVKEQTLTNVSRELHDNFGQIASLIKINLSMISKELSASDTQKVNESLELLKQLIGDIKSLSSSLNGDLILKNGWLKILSEDVRRINTIGAMQISFEHDPVLSLPHEKEVILYRVIQEIINNSLKYAKAKDATLSLKTKQNRVFIEFSDSGIGFDEKLIIPGNGLRNIRERCRIIDADFNISSKVGEGTKININIAMDGNNE